MDNSKKPYNRTEIDSKDMLNRLSRIEGQVRGVRAMVEEERYCTDIVMQISAIQSALNSFNKVLLEKHIKSCVMEEIKMGNEESIEELCRLIFKMMK